MSLTINTLTYSQDVPTSANKVPYVGPSHTFTTKDLLTLGRIDPKPTATYAGNARYEVKRTKTVELNGDSSTTADAIITTSFSLPVGMAQADVNSLRDDMGDFLIGTECGTFLWNRDLTY
jgi:hypothetical protein